MNANNKRKKELTGKRFGRLLVIKEISVIGRYGRIMWLCKCDCGKEKNVFSDLLLSGKTRSCGCLGEENKNRFKTHGMRHTRIYECYLNMMRRCYEPKNKRYKNYGGRGIKVCDKWQRFEGFFEDMHLTYKENLTIDRIDNDGDYCMDNCRWIDLKTQENNRSNNVKLTYMGMTKTVSEWGEYLGISKRAIYFRLYRGWDVEKTLTQPVRVTRRQKC